MQDTETKRCIWLLGPAAAALFAVSLTGFAAMRTDGYSHATKAVSELGSLDAPNALAFNLLGFIAPGVMLVLFSLALLQRSRMRAGPLLLMASGVMLALAGIAPANLDDYGALTSQLHALGAIGSGVLWVIALFWLGPMLRRDFGLELWGRITPWFATFLFANVGWQIAFRATGLVMPGWGQRIGFMGYFGWIAITGLLLWRRSLKSRQDKES